MGKTAESVGADVFQFFTRNPRGGAAKATDSADISKLLEISNVNKFGKLLAHAPYTLNACAANDDTRQFAFDTMADDLKRMEYLPHNYYNFHPGSHVGQGVETGVEKIADVLNGILTQAQTTTVLLETMAGKGSEVGGTFEELRAVIDRVKLSDKVGVCLDTCHVFDAGYDIVNDLDGVLKRFDDVIGLRRLKAVHLNDSKNPLGSRKDRHEKIGQGFIGAAAVKRIINHPLLKDLPFYLETPNELDGYAAEIKQLKLWRE